MATQHYVRGESAPGHGPWLSPDDAVKAAAVWRQLERTNYSVTDYLQQGLTRKEIAAKLGWSPESLRRFLSGFTKHLRSDLNARKADTARRLYRQETTCQT